MAHCKIGTLLVIALVFISSAEGILRGGKYTLKSPEKQEGEADLGIFGYSDTGKLKLTVTVKKAAEADKQAVVWTGEEVSSKGNPPIVFALYQTEEVEQVHADIDWSCSKLQSTTTLKYLRLQAVETKSESEQSNSEDKVFSIVHLFRTGDAGFWRLIASPCSPEGPNETSPASSSRFEGIVVKVEECNLKSDGTCNYLQVGDQDLPLFFFVFAAVFGGILVQWCKWMQENKEHLHKIHFLMAGVLVLKTLSLFFESLRYVYYKENGSKTDFFDQLFNIFVTLKGLLLFVVIVLIATGWSFLKPHLTSRDKTILMIVIPLQVAVSVLSYIVEHYKEEDPSYLRTWNRLLMLELICCILVAVPILWSVKQLREAQNAGGKVAKNLARMKQFRTLYIAILCYVYVKTIICSAILPKFVSYKYTWCPIVIGELAAAVCFVFVGLKFRPMKESPFQELNEEDFIEAGDALERELEDLEKDKDDLEHGNQPYDIRGGTANTLSAKAEDRKGGGGVSAVKRVADADF